MSSSAGASANTAAGSGGGGGGGGESSGYPDLLVVFDFFSDNPQKVMPQPPASAAGSGAISDVSMTSSAALAGGGRGVAVGAGRQKDNPFFDPYWEPIRKMQGSELFVEGMLLRSVDYKAQFPYLHYIIYRSASEAAGGGGGAPGGGGVGGFGGGGVGEKSRVDKHGGVGGGNGGGMFLTPVGLDSTGRHSGGASRNLELNRQYMDILRNQGGYSEMYTFVARRTPLLPKRPSNPNTAYIVSAFKTAGNLDSLDRSWTYWSGADYIVENIPKNLKLERVTFHKFRPVPPPGGGPSLTVGSDYCRAAGDAKSDGFSYVLLCEIREALADLNRAREFIDTLKYRQCGVTSMYVIDHFF